MIRENQYTLNQCKDKNYCWLGRGEDFHTGAMFDPVNAKKGCEKSSVAVQIDARIQSSNFHLTFC